MASLCAKIPAKLSVDSIGRRNTLIMEVLDDGNSRLGQEDQ